MLSIWGLLTILSSLIVGFLAVTTSIGGVILIPTLIYFLGMDSHIAMGTVLFSFLFSTSLSSWLFSRTGYMDWRLAFWLCLGTLPFAYLGAVAKAHASASFLNMVLALLTLLGGAVVFRPVRGGSFAFMAEGSPWRTWVILAVGASVGFICGMTGAGGPILSTPILIALGIAPISVVASAQVYSIAVAVSGSLGNIQHGAIDWVVGFWIIVAQMSGVLIGIRYIERLNRDRLRRIIAWVCLATGSFLLVDALYGILVRS